jgi:Mrp family chromosome partitioning ATPase
LDLIKQALTKAKTSDDQRQAASSADRNSFAKGRTTSTASWQIPMLQLDSEHLEQKRIVSFTRTDPSFVAFNMLRTNIYKTMKDNGWRGLAITSPTAGCGKTMVAVNLALSLARSPDCRVVLVDLDLKRPAVAKTLGIHSTRYISEHLEGRATLSECFVRTDDNLYFGLNQYSIRDSSETLQDPRVPVMLIEINKQLSPDIMIFDLPPMRAGDDAISFMPSVESSLLVAAAGETTAADIALCAEEISGRTNFIGVLLNKCIDIAKQYYY